MSPVTPIVRFCYSKKISDSKRTGRAPKSSYRYCGDDDILIGGYTSYGCDHEAWCEILNTWTRRDLSYARRINSLNTGPYKLNRTTVFDDGDYDLLTGAAGDDWFFIGASDKTTDRRIS